MNCSSRRGREPRRNHVPRGFTIVELLVSTALITGIMLLLIGTVDQTQRVWRRSTEKTAQFQAARDAFESMTRRLSQATLNAHWRAFETDLSSTRANLRFRRQAELQFLSGSTATIFGASPGLSQMPAALEESFPTHSVFFQAPLGHTEELQPDASQLRRFRGLDTLLTACGYFVEYGRETDRPRFIEGMETFEPRYRFRLMELTVPSEHVTVFNRPKDTLGFNDPRIFDETGNYPYVGLVDDKLASSPGWVRPLWMKQALIREPLAGKEAGSRFRYARSRAENVIALIILPKLPEKDRQRRDEPELAPTYLYDSWRILVRGSTNVRDGSTTVKVDNVARDNLLPPVVQVTMVAIDEPFMSRLAPNESTAPKWTAGLFKKAKTDADYRHDVAALEKELRKEARLNYRIFSTDLVLRGSKWSRDPVFEQPNP